MLYVILVLVGIVLGSVITALVAMSWYTKVKQRVLAAESQSRRAKEIAAAAEAKEQELADISRRLFLERQEFDKKVISHQELEQANRILKRDLKNMDVQVSKLELDAELGRERVKELEERSTQMTRQYLSDAVQAIVSSAGAGEFAAGKGRLDEVIARCRAMQVAISEQDEAKLHDELRKAFNGAPSAAAIDAPLKVP